MSQLAQEQQVQLQPSVQQTDHEREHEQEQGQSQRPLQTFSQPHPIEPKRLQDLVNEIDPDEQLDEEVEKVLLDIADEFIESVVTSACTIAKHRNSNSLEVDDVKLFLERKFGIWVPGFGESKPVPRRFANEAHRQRMALINKQQDSNKPADEQNNKTTPKK